jgi:hypothetical protein
LNRISKFSNGIPVKKHRELIQVKM